MATALPEMPARATPCVRRPLQASRLVCLIHFPEEPASAAEAMAVRMGVTVERLLREALIEGACVRHRRAVRLLGGLYDGILCTDLTDALAEELQRVSGLPLLDAHALLAAQELPTVRQASLDQPLAPYPAESRACLGLSNW